MTHWPPRLPTIPLQKGAPLAQQARQLLAEVGGLAGTRYIQMHLTAQTDRPLTIRQTRDALRSVHIRKLGASYFALKDTLFEPVLDFAERQVRDGPLQMTALIAVILEHYPRGDALAVRCWLQQEPGRLQRAGELIRLTPQRWRQP